MQTHDCKNQAQEQRQQITTAMAQTAHLSMLALTDGEKRGLSSDFGNMLAFADRLQACPAQADAAAPRTTPTRADVPTKGLTLEQVLLNAPAREGRFIAVPRAME